MRKFQIGVVGYNDDKCTPDAKKIAFEVGKEIALSKSVLVCGGLGGVMKYACKGAKKYEGITVGIIPQEEFSFANKYCDIVICSTVRYARNFIVAASVDALIIIGGGSGTLNELTIGYMYKKKMIAISGSGGVAKSYGGKYLDERKRVKIMTAVSAEEAVKKALQ